MTVFKKYFSFFLLVVSFFIEFCIRLFINPKYAPAMILGRIIVQNQKPEYTGAPQKYFAWALGLGMATFMGVLLFIFNLTGIINLIVCSVCLLLLLSETSFGICIGCKMYGWITRKKPQLCPGNICEVTFKEKIQEVNRSQISVLLITIVLGIFIVYMFNI